jgi:hypothetical protein
VGEVAVVEVEDLLVEEAEEEDAGEGMRTTVHTYIHRLFDR